MKFSGFNTTEKVGIGIGTNVPSRPLEVNGTGNASVIRVGDGDTDGAAAIAYIEFGANSTSWDRHSYVGSAGADSHLWIVNEENADIKFYANNAEKMVINNDGNVGIGTTAPSHPLHVYSTVGNASAILIDGSASNSGYLSFRQAGVEKAYIQYTANSYLRYSKAGGFHSFAQAVAIGTTAVGSYALYVNGTGYFGGPITTTANSAGCSSVWKAYSSGYGVNKYQTNAGVDKWNIGLNSSNEFYIYNYAASEVALKFDTSSNTTFSGALTGTGRITAKVGSGNEASIVIDNNASGKAGDAYLRYAVYNGVYWATGIDNSDVDKFKISKSSDLGTNDFLTIDTAGLVGIGTTAPSGLLDLYEPASGDNKLRFHSSATGTGTSNGSRIGLNGTELFINNLESSTIKIYTQSTATNGITIASDGKVGIGSTTPLDKLHVQGNILQLDGSPEYHFGTISASHLNWRVACQEVVSQGFEIASGTASAGTSAPSDTYTNRFVIKGATGQIQFNSYGGGTHTGTSAYKLSVDSSGNIIETSIGSGAVDGAGTANYIPKWTDGDTIGNSTVYNSGSLVGIGTNAPLSPLQIGSKENWAFANAAPVLSIRETTSTATGGYGAFHVQAADDDSIFLIKVQSSGGYAELATQYNSSGEYKDISIFAAGNKDVYLQRTGTGKVGIGTTAPARKLHVLGGAVGIQARLTAASGWGTGLEFYDGDSAGRHWRIGTSNNVAGDFSFISGTSTGAAPTATRVTILKDGYVGIGTATPNNNQNVTDRVQLAIGNTAQVGGRASGTPSWFNISHGTYFDGTNWKYYSAADEAALIEGYNGGLYARMAVAGTNAGDNITWVTALTVLNTGYVHMDGAAQVRLTLGSQGTPGTNDCNWIRGTGTNLGFNAGGGSFHWEVSGTERMNLAAGGQLKLNTYGSGTHTGTAAYKLSVTSGGIVIETPIGAGAVDGAGTANYVAKWTDGDTIGNSIIYDDGTNDVGVGVVPTAVNTSHKSLQIGGNVNIQSYGTKGAGGEVDYCHNVYLNQDGNYKLISADEATMYRQGGGKHTFYSWASGSAGSNVTVTGPKLMILADGKVGIGGTPTTAQLDILSSVSGNYLFMDDGANCLWKISSTTTSGIIQTQATGWSSWKPMDLRANYFQFKPNNSEVMRITSTGVGIGTTAPSKKLHLYGSGSVGMRVQSTSLTARDYDIYTDGDEIYIEGVGGSSGSFQTGENGTFGFKLDLGAPANSFYLNGSGNVGIGTTAPASLLHLRSTGDARIIINADSDNSGEGDNPSIEMMQDGSVSHFKLGVEGIAGTEFTGSIANTPYLDSTNTGGPYGLQFATNNAARMIIAGDGKVGIGSTAPWVRLDLGYDASALMRATRYFIYDSNRYIEAESTAIKYYGTAGHNFHTSGGEKVRIQTDGNVGIGTTSPDELLRVGNANVGATDRRAISLGMGGFANPGAWNTPSNGDKLLILGDAHSSLNAVMGIGDSGIWFKKMGNATDVVASFWGSNANSGSATQLVTIKDNGKVGIGTAAPDHTLEVQGSTTTRGFNLRGGGASGVHVFSATHGTGTDGSYFTITDLGNVGIGTTAPGYKLDVNGTANIVGALTGTSATFSGAVELSTAGSTLYLRNAENTGNHYIRPTTGKLTINNASGTEVAVTSTGLAVTGTGSFTGALTGTTGAFSGAITGYTLAVTADNSGWNPGIALINTNADSSPAYLKLEKISASPANGDYIGGIVMRGRNSAAEAHSYIEQWGVATNVTNGSESSKWNIGTWGSGTEYAQTLVAREGNVGIGTGVPAAPLHVTSSVAADTEIIRIQNLGSSSANVWMSLYRGGTENGRLSTSYDQLTLQARNNKNVNIFDDSGNGLTVADGGAATFSGSVRAEDRFDLYDAANVWQFKNVGGLFSLRNGNTGAVPISITSAGAATFSGALTGTTATFSGNVSITNTAANAILTLNPTVSVYSIIKMYGAGSIANGLDITVGQANAYYSAGAHTFRNAAQSANYGVFSSTGLAVTGELSVSSTVKAAGKLVVGSTATPISKFQIHSTQSDTMTDAEAFLALKGNGGDGMLMGQRATSPYGAWIQAGYLPNIGTSHHYPLLLQPHGSNVGIGTTAPAKLLHVEGEVRFKPSSIGYLDFLRVNDYACRIRNPNGNLSLSGGSILFEYGTSSDLRMKLFDSGGFAIGTTFTDTDPGAQNLTVQGSVGIGTTSPDGKLEVAGGTTLGLRLSNVGDSSAYDQIRTTYNGYNSGTPEMITMPMTTPGSGVVNTYFRYSNSNGSSTTSNNKASVTIGNKLGVGIDSPTALLQVEGGGSEISTQPLKVSAVWGQTTIPMVLFENRHDGNGLKITNNAARSDAELFEITNSAGTVVMVKGDGNVGIGITAPAYKLEVSGSVTGDWLCRINNTATTSTPSGLIVRTGYNSATATGGYLLGLLAGPDYRLVVQNDGNVGIGTITPGYLLDVRGTVFVNGATYIAADTRIRGKLSRDGGPVSAGTETWFIRLSASNTVIAALTNSAGGALATGGCYRFTAHVSGTGTDQSARAVFWNQNGTWYVNKTSQYSGSSNQPEFLVSSSVPSIKTSHSSQYLIETLCERIILDEAANGTDNTREYYGADGFMSSITSTEVLSYNVGTTTSRTVYHSGNFTPGNYLPLAGGTMTGTLTTSSSIVQSGNGSTIDLGTADTGNGSPSIRFIGSNSTYNWRLRQNDNNGGDFTIKRSTAGGGTTFESVPTLQFLSDHTAIFRGDVKAGVGTLNTAMTPKFAVLDTKTVTNTTGDYYDNHVIIADLQAASSGNNYNDGRQMGLGFACSTASGGNPLTIASIRGVKVGTGNNHQIGELSFCTSGTPYWGMHERMRITYTGYVGIGTTAPSAMLHVYKSTNAFLNGLTLENPNTGSSAMTGLYLNCGGKTLDLRVKNALSGNTGYINSSGTLYTGLLHQGGICLVAKDGKVGIGTATPYAPLTTSIVATNTIATDDASSTAGIVVSGTSNLVRLQLGVGGSTMGPYGGWIQASYDNTGGADGVEPLLLNPIGGNVGIGNAAPSADTGVAKFLQIGSSAVASSGLVLEDNTGQWEMHNDTHLTFLYDGTERMLIGANGTVNLRGATNLGHISQYENSVLCGFIGSGSSLSGGTNTDYTVRSVRHLDFLTNNTTTIRMRVQSDGNVGIGTETAGYKLQVQGDILASGAIMGNSKSFVIDHPTKPSHKLQYGALEGPEFGVYHRGRVQSDTIVMPDYWSGLVRDGTITVQLTPNGSFQHLYVVSTSLTEIKIGAADGETIDCYYTIYGERADLDPLVVEKIV